MLTFTDRFVSLSVSTWDAEDVTIGACSVIDATPDLPVVMGQGVRIGHNVVVSAGVELGRDVRLDSQTYIGSGTKIGDGSEIHGVKVHRDIRIGRNTFVGGEVSNWTVIGDEVTFMGRIVHTYRHPGSAESWRHASPQPSPVVHDRAVVGECALLMGGIEIGAGAYVAAGEVVKVNVPAGHIAMRGRILPLSSFRGFIRGRD